MLEKKNLADEAKWINMLFTFYEINIYKERLYSIYHTSTIWIMKVF